MVQLFEMRFNEMVLKYANASFSTRFSKMCQKECSYKHTYSDSMFVYLLHSQNVNFVNNLRSHFRFEGRERERVDDLDFMYNAWVYVLMLWCFQR